MIQSTEQLETVVQRCNMRIGEAAHYSICSGEGREAWRAPQIHLWDDRMLSLKSPEAFTVVVRALRRCGFRVHKDRDIQRHHRVLSPGHRAGETGRARVKVAHHGRHLEVGFYADPNPTHRYPEHGDHVFEHLPYLDAVRLRWAIASCAAALRALGIADATVPSLSPLSQAEYRERTSGHWCAGDVSIFDRPRWWSGHMGGSYYRECRVDADGVDLYDGAWRAFYDYRGRLGYGRVFATLNGAWMGVTPEEVLPNLSHVDIFTPRPGVRPPRFHPRRARERLERVLDKWVEAQEFERAIPVRDLLRAMAKCP